MMPKTLVLTGGSRGIGKATAIKFLNQGWLVISCSREKLAPAYLSELPKTIACNYHHICADLAQEDHVEDFIQSANQILGDSPLNALVNNAAQSPKSSYKERLGCLNGDLSKWKEVFALNFFAPLALARGFAPALAKGAKHGERSSSIVNITSIAGHATHPFAGSAYSTSKAALSALTREMAVEFAQLGVRVNAIAPGEIKTDMLGPEYEPLTTRIPMQRLGLPEEVANVIFELCQAEFSYVTGSEIFLTGGQHLY